MKKFHLKCQKNCGHTEREHKAFDAGLWAGENGQPESSCLLTGELREAWLTGHSVGKLNSIGLTNKMKKELTDYEREIVRHSYIDGLNARARISRERWLIASLSALTLAAGLIYYFLVK
jgi:hypothetical protein